VLIGQDGSLNVMGICRQLACNRDSGALLNGMATDAVHFESGIMPVTFDAVLVVVMVPAVRLAGRIVAVVRGYAVAGLADFLGCCVVVGIVPKTVRRGDALEIHGASRDIAF
jgi:hypothetical protein